MKRKLKLTFSWPYDNDIETLYRLLYIYIEYNEVTIEMTQAEYDNFTTDTDTEEDLHASNFRPTNDQTNNCKLNWIFAGKLEFRIKIVK